ncbi:F-box/kelch-repeat protein At3g06240-like [Rhodamnia argentea]|uniref:F-box/kelch-repeat protein At3g06240-like n=1 Tax=Rhodamnia argentea TaxID=178133 RepID=A0ABM3HR92_9MYRT|nr:F-box/kelch-repeat protein At3g06240-like [Rhodamnia argentea]
MNGPSAETMGDIFTEGIFIDILSRLPAKSLIRFKRVSKGWRSLISDLISDPSFVKLHLQRLKARDLIPSQRIIIGSPCDNLLQTVDYETLDHGSEDPLVVVPHSIEVPCRKPCIVGSCDGLVCLLESGIFLICNPTTREYRELPVSDIPRDYELFCGFGYDPRSDDYKIVEGVVDYGNWENWEVARFSFKSGSWRRIQFPYQELIHQQVSLSGVYWNGALHWYVYDLISDKKSMIMSFDLSEERFHWELPVPEVDVGMTLVGLGIHGASLFIHSGNYGPRMEAWIMDEHGRGGGSWTKWFSIDCTSVNLETGVGNAPLTYTRSGKVVLRVNSDRMILFNPKNNSCKDYPIRRHDPFQHAIYLETLVSPYLGGETSRI